MKQIAFSAERTQPFTKGHFYLNSEMLRDNDLIIIGIGSTQIERTSQNPFTPEERKDMFITVFGQTKKIRFVYLKDIGAAHPKEWQEYCLSRIKASGNPTPTRYYAGSKTDGEWFKDAINLDSDKIELITLNRYTTPFMSGTEIRKSISNGSNEWEDHVPGCLISFIKEKYPKTLTLDYHLNKKG